MNTEDSIAHLKMMFAERFAYATLTITHRKVKGKTQYYFKTVGAYKVDSGRFIQCYFETAYRYKEDFLTLTYHYRTE